MKKYVRNFISVYGNDAVKATHLEVIRRLRNHSELNPDTAIGEVLYGLQRESAELKKDKITAEWVVFATDYGDEDHLPLDSGGTTPDQLLNHIVWFYSKVDPKCVLHNSYDHTNNDFVGAIYKHVDRGGIRTFEEFILNNSICCSEDEIDGIEDNGFGKITWEQFWDLQREADSKAREFLLADFPDLEIHFR